VLSTAVPKLPWAVDALRNRAARPSAFLESLEKEDEPSRPPVLSDEQRRALEAFETPNDRRPMLLQGVTGSGKTEVYMAAIAAELERGKSAIVLVPEIALTPQVLRRFSERFPGKVACLHSGLTPKERLRQWQRIRSGKARIVVGARSAVFAPVSELGLVVVDEEHDASYKQEDSFRYHARDVAIARAAHCGARVLLGSATPSFETLRNVEIGKFRRVELTKRVRAAAPTQVRIVDMRDRNRHFRAIPWLSVDLVEGLAKTLADGHQSMVFLNRLGYAQYLVCTDCGHSWRCHQCDVTLTYYRRPAELRCHYCNFRRRPPDICEKCSSDRLDPVGLGTEQVEETLRELFPNARIARLDRAAVKTRRELESTLARIEKREVDIVVGTQMLAKGHDYPGVALVGVVLADASLAVPDFRAAERTFQLLTQVAGRAGRAEVPGTVLFQAMNPEAPAIVAAASGCFPPFCKAELEARQAFRYPPFTKLALVRFQHRNESTVQQFARKAMLRLLRASREVGVLRLEVLGPSPAPIGRVDSMHRWQALLRAERSSDIQNAIRWLQRWLEKEKPSVRVTTDVDPMHFL
jgi:primosomal protein N' (replication factor Y)